MNSKEKVKDIIEVLREIKRYKDPAWKHGHAKLALSEIKKLEKYFEIETKQSDITEFFKQI